MTVKQPGEDRPPDAAIIQFLGAYDGADPVGVQPLWGGFWSAAFGYRIAEDEFVLRSNDAAVARWGVTAS